MNLPQPLPSDAQSVAFVDSFQGAAARQIARAIGPAYQPADGTICAQDFVAMGGAIALGRRTNLNSIAEAFLDSTSQLISAWEAELGLPNRTDLTLAQRQSRLLGKWRARRSATVQAMNLALQQLDALANVYEITTAQASTAEPNKTLYPDWKRNVFRVVVQMSASSLTGATTPGTVGDAILRLAEQMKPAHAGDSFASAPSVAGVGTSVSYGVHYASFNCDDASSLCDTDLLTL